MEKDKDKIEEETKETNEPEIIDDINEDNTDNQFCIVGGMQRQV